MVNHNTELNMIIGYPLAHTLTPILHNTVYKLLKLNAVMLAHATSNLANTMQALKTLSVGLIAVTMPYKQELMPYLDTVSEEVKVLKNANTIICHSGKLRGYNTDIDGIAYALRQVELSKKNILLLGGGGAAHTVAFYLKQYNANLFYLNRRFLQSLALISLFGGKAVDILDLNNIPIDIIINATPLGMVPNIEASPLPNYQFRSNQIVFDMVYNPENTALIKKAKSQGATCISGLDMFIAQGLKQIELYANKEIGLDCHLGNSMFSGTGVQPSTVHTIPGRDVLQTWNGPNDSQGKIDLNKLIPIIKRELLKL